MGYIHIAMALYTRSPVVSPSVTRLPADQSAPLRLFRALVVGHRCFSSESVSPIEDIVPPFLLVDGHRCDFDLRHYLLAWLTPHILFVTLLQRALLFMAMEIVLFS